MSMAMAFSTNLVVASNNSLLPRSSSIATNSLFSNASSFLGVSLKTPSSFLGVSLKTNVKKCHSLTLSATKPLTVVTAAKKAGVDGVKTSTQEDEALATYIVTPCKTRDRTEDELKSMFEEWAAGRKRNYKSPQQKDKEFKDFSYKVESIDRFSDTSIAIRELYHPLSNPLVRASPDYLPPDLYLMLCDKYGFR